MAITLELLTTATLRPFHDFLTANELWPKDRFDTAPSFAEAAELHERGEYVAFRVTQDGATSHYAAVVMFSRPYLELVQTAAAPIDVDAGRAAVAAIVRWTFANTQLPCLYHYLERPLAHLAKRFAELGFERVDDEGAEGRGEQLLVVFRKRFAA